MLRALRVVSVERGHDPRDSRSSRSAVPGRCTPARSPTSSAAATVLVPDAAGVLSALGLVASDERRDHVRSSSVRSTEVGELPGTGRPSLRYRGQSFELDGPAGRRARGALPSRARGALRLRGPGARDRARRRAHGRDRAGAAVDLVAGPARSVAGPALVELAGATCWVPEGGPVGRTRRARSCWSGA